MVRQSTSIVNRRHIRFITIGTLLAFTPTALLSLLPNTLGADVYVPYALTFTWLLIALLTHLYLFFPKHKPAFSLCSFKSHLGAICRMGLAWQDLVATLSESLALTGDSQQGLLFEIAGRADGPQAALPKPVVENVRQEMLGMVARLRRVTGALRPAGLDELGLSTAIEGYVARLQREQGVAGPRIQFTLDPVGTTLPEPVAICLFRVAQEGIRNALKHAQATQIQISLTINPEEIVLRIEDDGRGFRLPARLGQLAEHHHFGLIGIAEQVNAIAGCFTIDPQPDSGTTIWVRIPLIDKEVNYV